MNLMAGFPAQPIPTRLLNRLGKTMTPQTSIERHGSLYEVRCSRCPDWHPRRELRLDAETLAQRHMDEHARERRSA